MKKIYVKKQLKYLAGINNMDDVKGMIDFFHMEVAKIQKEEK